MSNWVTCPACSLKHSARPDGTCPRCKTTIGIPVAQAAAVAPTAAAFRQASAPAPAAVRQPPVPATAALRQPSVPAPVMVEAPPELAPAVAPVTPGAAVPGFRAAATSPGVPLVAEADLVYPHEPALFAISLLISVIVWLALLVGTVGMALMYVPFVFLMYLFTQSALIAYLKGNAIKVTPRQFPDLHARIVACAERLGIAQVPDCYLLNGQGGFNAFATRFLGRNFVILFSDVVDALEEQPGAVDFYLGHELAHVKRGHLVWRSVLMPASFLPLLGAAYQRACESTCDRHGAACCGDTQDAIAALTALAAGNKRWKTLSFDEYVAQAEESGGFWMSFNELVSDYPWLVKRLSRVVAFRDGLEMPLPARNPFAYLFALFVPRAVGGGGGGAIGLLLVVAIIGIVAAIAIPSLLRARVAANEAATLSDLRSVMSAEAAFVGEHGGATSLECLAGSPGCRVPAAPPALPSALAASSVRHGYRFALTLDGRDGSAFSYTAVPVTAGQTGVRSFCADGSGEIYAATGQGQLTDFDGTSCSPGLTPVGSR